MRVGELMTRDVVTTDVSATARDVARLMAQRNVGSVVVTEDRKCVGLVTDRDVVVHAVGQDLDPSEVPVSDIMTDKPIACKEDQTIFDAAQLAFSQGPFRRLPVVDKEGEVIGIISVADLALAAHPLLEAVLGETEASVGEAKVEQLKLKRKLREKVPTGQAR